MSLILQIDTALETAAISIAEDGELLGKRFNQEQKDHASFLQPAIQSLFADLKIDLKEIDAIAVAAGPGSYTGLRVGMASAKGFCFALSKPFITVGSLEILTYAAVREYSEDDILYCPMIDARRMEVYTALYDKDQNTLAEPAAMILEPSSFANWLLKNKICFFGSGSPKWKAISSDKNALFPPPGNNALALSKLAFQKFENQDFTDLAYAEPLYLKEFFATNAS